MNRIIDLDSRSMVPTEFEPLGISQEIIDLYDYEDFALIKACVITQQSREMSTLKNIYLVQIQSKEAPMRSLEIQFKPDFLDSRALPPKKAYGRIFSCSSKYLYYVGALGELVRVDVRHYQVACAPSVLDAVNQIATVSRPSNSRVARAGKTFVYCVDVAGTVHCLCEDTLAPVAKNRLYIGFFFVVAACEKYVLAGGYSGVAGGTGTTGYLEVVVLLNRDLIELERASIGGQLATGFRDLKILDLGNGTSQSQERIFAIGVRSRRSIAVFQIYMNKIVVLIPDKVVTTGDIYGLLGNSTTGAVFIYGPNLLKQYQIRLNLETN